MSWQDSIEQELTKAFEGRQSGNDGLARTVEPARHILVRLADPSHTEDPTLPLRHRHRRALRLGHRVGG